MTDNHRRGILVVSRVYRGGGAERQAVLLASRLAEEGFPVTVLSFRTGEGDVPPPGVRLLNAAEVAAPESAGRRRLRRLLARALRPSALPLLTLCVHLHRFRSAYPLAAAADGIAARVALHTFAGAGHTIRAAVSLTGAATVIAFLPSMYGAAAAGLWTDPVRLIASDRSDPSRPVVKAHWRAMQHLVARRAQVFGANTSAAAQWICEEHQLRHHREPIITPNILASIPATVAPDASRFVAVSRLVSGKGVDRLIDAFAAIVEELPQWRLDVAGDGVERLALEQRAADAGVRERCSFLGEVPVETVLKDGGILVHPSDLEGMPNAVMEAMAYGLPCIVTAGSPGPVELVVGPQRASDEAGHLQPAGIVVKPRDADALAEAMRELANSSVRRSALARGARRRAESLVWAARRDAWLSLVEGDGGAKPRTGKITDDGSVSSPA